MRAEMSRWQLPLLLVLSATSTALATQPECVSGEELDLTLAASTNATGHRRVSARLEQPLVEDGWQVHVQVGTRVCENGRGDGGPQRQWLVLILDGSPAGRPLAPSPAPTPAKPPSLAPPGYLTLPGLGHYRAPPEAKDWYKARKLCREEGGGLLVPTSRSEVEKLFEHFFPPNVTGAYLLDRLWLGASDFEQEGTFVTEDGVPIKDIGHAEFHAGQPDGKRAENCLALYKSGLLLDGACAINLAFICKVPL